MRVEQVTFRGFKSLHDLTLPLGDMTVLTGPNGSGKSNVLAGLEFLGNLYRAGLRQAVAMADGYDHIAYRREGGPVLSLGFEVDVRLDRTELLGVIRSPVPDDGADLPEYLGVHTLVQVRALAADPVSAFEFGREELEVHDSHEDLRVGVYRDNGEISYASFPDQRALNAYDRFFPAGFLHGLYDGGLTQEFVNLIFFDAGDNSMPLVGGVSRYFSPMRLVRDFLGALQFHQLAPQVCRQAALPGVDVRMGRHGENLAAAADYVRQHDEQAWLKIQEAAVGVVPGLERVEVVPTEDRKLALRFHERGVLRPWRAVEVSDGTVQAFALFAALFDRRLPLLAVEEPENALHPWILRKFVDLCQSEPTKQVVLTTHSPALINYVPGEWVNLVWREEGKTMIGRLLDMDPDAKKLWESGEVGLFDIYDGGVVPRSVPGG